MLVNPTFSMFHPDKSWKMMVSTSNSNHFHEFGKTSGAGGSIVSGIMEIVGNVSKTNIFHDFWWPWALNSKIQNLNPPAPKP